MTELQRCELNLLRVFLETCQQLNLRYYLVCGSALGAVKYQGFIPWDDDIDVAMPRSDYEIFLQKAAPLLPEHVFLQNSKTDSEFPLIFSKLRDSRTTFIEFPYRRLNMNHGIYIDIFPLDGYPKDIQQQKKFEKKKAYFERRRKVRIAYPRWKYPAAVKTNLVYLLFRFFGFYRDTAETIRCYNQYLSRWDADCSRIWCNHGNWQGTVEYCPRDQYGTGVTAQFEGIDVMIPEQFDAYLTQKYGSWREDPPLEKQISHHECVICDLLHSFTQYTKKGL